MCSYAAKNIRKHKQLVQTAVLKASYLFFIRNWCRRMFISMCYLGNLLIGIIMSNYINFHEIMCSYETINVKKVLNNLFQQ
jgi:hypothetical protein